MSDSGRRLAAIMFTDMVGYTALGQKSESLSLALVEEQRKLIRPILAKHDGREVKTMGDAFLVEFSGALNAVRCAYDIQRATREFNISLPRERRLHLRVGVHLGDVVESNGDISGDAVNLASRIEPLADDGGVCLTRQVYDQIYNKFELPLQRIGKRTLKNVAVPVEAYKVVFPWDEQTPKKSAIRTLDRKRVAILPLLSLSPDPNDEYFADGTTEEMISTLSNISGLTVISRTSVMQYKGAKKNLSDIGKELKAGTILEGSVRKAGNHVRITVQLLDATEDKHVWVQNYDRELEDVFAVQSDIAKNVAESLRVKLVASETRQIQKKPTESTEAYLLYLKGRHEWNKRSEEGCRKAIEYFTAALDHDSNFALAYVGLADAYFVLSDEGGMTRSEAFERARRAVSKALLLDDGLAETHTSYAWVLLDDLKWDEAETEFNRAIELNANYATAHQWYSLLLGFEGRVEEKVAEAKKALDLDPLAPVVSGNVGWTMVDQERPDDAIGYFKRSLAVEPNFVRALHGLSVAYQEKEEFDEAMRWWEKFAQAYQRKSFAMLALAILQASAGDKDGALKSLDSAMTLQDSGKLLPFELAIFFAVLGDENKALHYLEKGLMEGDPPLGMKAIPVFKEMRSNPRFLAILKKMGLDKY